MQATTTRVLLTPRNDDWDDLTELLEHLEQYLPNHRPALYAAIQKIAEGMSAKLDIPSDRVEEFQAHMREFRIQVEPA